ncbi:MAG TPA: response regulator [candidate division Zixibacteria bacterium]|nr:response regulator [candidate division Zixibacteria bacterium]
MTLTDLKLLVVEDNPGDLRLLKEMLRENSPHNMIVHEAGTMAEAEERILEFTPDLILLDLNLPDSSGPGTYEHFHQRYPDVPVIVLTGLSDERVALATIQHGAQDYLIKGEFDSRLLTKSINYSLERHRLSSALNDQKRKEQQLRELSSLSRITDQPATSISASSLGIKRIKDVSDQAFGALVEEAVSLTEHALEQRAVRVEGNLSIDIRNLATTLGKLNAGPRDVIDIYRASLNRVSQTRKPTIAAVMAEEARYVTLELMGYLANYYRDLAGGNNTVVFETGAIDTSDMEV